MEEEQSQPTSSRFAICKSIAIYFRSIMFRVILFFRYIFREVCKRRGTSEEMTNLKENILPQHQFEEIKVDPQNVYQDRQYDIEQNRVETNPLDVTYLEMPMELPVGGHRRRGAFAGTPRYNPEFEEVKHNNHLENTPRYYKKIKFDKDLVQDETCCICFENLSSKTVVHLICNPLHIFHEDCIQNWLSRNDKCPICRERIKSDSIYIRNELDNFRTESMSQVRALELMLNDIDVFMQLNSDAIENSLPRISEQLRNLHQTHNEIVVQNNRFRSAIRNLRRERNMENRII